MLIHFQEAKLNITLLASVNSFKTILNRFFMPLGLIIYPKRFIACEELYYPLFRDYIFVIHHYGKYVAVFLHSSAPLILCSRLTSFLQWSALYHCFRHSVFFKIQAFQKIFNVFNNFSLPSRTPLTFVLKASRNARLELESSNATGGKKHLYALKFALKFNIKRRSLA